MENLTPEEAAKEYAFNNSMDFHDPNKLKMGVDFLAGYKAGQASNKPEQGIDYANHKMSKDITATEVLREYGIEVMLMDDFFNTQLLHAMERYAESKQPKPEQGMKDVIINQQDSISEIIREHLNSLEIHKWWDYGDFEEIRDKDDVAYNTSVAIIEHLSNTIPSHPEPEEKKFTLEQMIRMCCWIFDGDYIHTLTNSHDVNKEIIKLVKHYSTFPQLFSDESPSHPETKEGEKEVK